jgi:hypothetical protein
MLLTAGVAAGCTSSTSPSASPHGSSSTTTGAMPRGYTRFTDHADRFTIAVPVSWRRIDPSSPGASQAFAELLRSNPGIANATGTDSAALLSQGMKLLAIDVGSPTEPTIDVITRPAPGLRDSDLPQVLDAVKSEYASAGFRLARTQPISVGGHKGLEETLHVSLAAPSGGTVSKSEIQDLVAANDLLYVVTLSGTSAAFPTIVKSFKVS